jgi:Ca2+-binding EF-hand superfamily protein
MDLLYREIDDCGFKFVDTCALNRFLHKCGLAESQSRIVAIIRRLDLDADARLSFNEFTEAVTP